MALAGDAGLEDEWTAPEVLRRFAPGGLAAPRARSAVWRPASDLESVWPRTCGPHLRRDASRRGHRASRPAHGPGGHRADRCQGGHTLPGHRYRSRRTGPSRRPADGARHAHGAIPGRRARLGWRGAVPPDWEAQIDALPRPTRETLFEIVFTSGTTAAPKGAMLSHGNILATLEAADHVIPRRQHRLVSLLPLSHLFGQLEMAYALMVGAPVLYIRSRNPRVIFEAIAAHHVTTMVVVPQVLDLFWSSFQREVDKRGKTAQVARLRSVSRRSALRHAAVDLPLVPRAPRRSAQAVHLLGCLPASGPATGLGRRRRRHHPGVRLDGVRLRGRQSDRRPPTGRRRPAGRPRRGPPG